MRSLLAATSLHAIVGLSMAVGVAVPLVTAQAQTSQYNVNFASGSSTLDSTAMQVVRQAAQAFRTGDGASINLVGHADTTGNATLNQRLSERRSAAVENALINEGVSP